MTNAAKVTLSGASTVFNEINGLANNQGSFTVANGRNFTTVGALANSGTLVAAGGSTLTVSGALNQAATGTLTGNGTFTAVVLLGLGRGQSRWHGFADHRRVRRCRGHDDLQRSDHVQRGRAVPFRAWLDDGHERPP